MFKQSRGSLLDTARWVLAVWAVLVVSSVLAPCKVAFALPRQGDPINIHAIAGAQGHAHQDQRVAGEVGTNPLDALHCIESPNPLPSKTVAASASASGAFSLTAINGDSPYSEAPSVPRLLTLQLDARPQVFLKTSRLLI